MYVRKKKRPFSSSHKARSPQLKAYEMFVRREARVLTRSLSREKGKLVELRPPSPKIHVTESKEEVLKEVEISIPVVVVKKKRNLVLLASSSSSSHHSASAL